MHWIHARKRAMINVRSRRPTTGSDVREADARTIGCPVSPMLRLTCYATAARGVCSIHRSPATWKTPRLASSRGPCSRHCQTVMVVAVAYRWLESALRGGLALSGSAVRYDEACQHAHQGSEEAMSPPSGDVWAQMSPQISPPSGAEHVQTAEQLPGRHADAVGPRSGLHAVSPIADLISPLISR